MHRDLAANAGEMDGCRMLPARRSRLNRTNGRSVQIDEVRPAGYVTTVSSALQARKQTGADTFACYGL
jgi:hypothetical protein